MLIALNKSAEALNLSNAEYRIMATLISLWNMKKGYAYPTYDYLINKCAMGKLTIIRSLRRLEEFKLLIIERNRGMNNKYYLDYLLSSTRPGFKYKPTEGIT
ncbi:MAG: helix-turn-helix domain-containing protein [Cyanobacteriota bacterium]